jgi:hypothetical protein
VGHRAADIGVARLVFADQTHAREIEKIQSEQRQCGGAEEHPARCKLKRQYTSMTE